MNTAGEIKSLAIQKKDKIWNWYFHSQLSSIYKTFGGFQKHELNSLLFLSVDKPLELCRLLKKPFFDLQNIINEPSYTFFTVPKKKGGNREIYAPCGALKKVQKQLNYYLQAYYLCVKPKEITGFVINPHYLGEYCNIVANAGCHVGKKYLLNIDLKDFFPGITAKRVQDVFRSDVFGFNDQIATALTLLTTFQGKLPIGAPTSPVISNFVCHQLDAELIDFCQKNGLTYSRYADDLTFSSNEPITSSIIEALEEMVADNHFVINNQKTRLTTINRRQTVTGLTVNEKVNVDRKLLKRTRAMVHDLNMNGSMSATCNHFGIENGSLALQEFFLNRLNGYINFIGQVRGKDDHFYLQLKSKMLEYSK
jgi:RNA-directed DNA polymerase